MARERPFELAMLVLVLALLVKSCSSDFIDDLPVLLYPAKPGCRMPDPAADTINCLPALYKEGSQAAEPARAVGNGGGAAGLCWQLPISRFTLDRP